MINHYIKNITIENFKCFQNLQVEGIERINLIGGKNDIGKTAFLEAVELLVSSSTAKDLAVNAHKILIRRQTNNVKISIKHIILNLIKRREKILKIIANNKTCKIYLNQFSFFDIETYLNRESHENDIVTDNTLSFIINRDKTTISIDKFLKYKINFPDIKILKNIKFINVAKEYDIVNLYSSLIDLERKEFLNTCLTKFDENIVSLNAVQTKDGLILKLKLKNKKNLILLSSLGEGINKY
ncbi:MAG: AAA family ATPase, partial [Candidatus Marithrix sp.]|nr:AAA family ATPase [Candidatus Marithrix sp.]